MGIKERKSRGKEDLRKLILTAAKKLFVKEGYEATSIRKIAAEIEFSPTTIYLYYKDKNDIVYALHKEGFTLMRSKMEVLTYVENPFERIKALGRLYLQFAIEHSEFYALMFIMKEPMEFLENNCVEKEWPDGERVFDFLVNTIKECQEQGYFKNLDTHLVALQAWSTVHGLAALYSTGHLAHVINHNTPELPMETILENVFRTYALFLENNK